MALVPLAGSPLNYLYRETGTIAQFDPGTGETRYILVEPPIENAEADRLVKLPIREMPEDLQAILRGEHDPPLEGGHVAFVTS